MAEILNMAAQTIYDRLKFIGKMHKSEKWMSHALLKDYDRNSMLHWIISGNEKSICLQNRKQKKIMDKSGTTINFSYQIQSIWQKDNGSVASGPERVLYYYYRWLVMLIGHNTQPGNCAILQCTRELKIWESTNCEQCGKYL